MVLTEIRSIPLTAGWLIRQVDDLVEASWTLPGSVRTGDGRPAPVRREDRCQPRRLTPALARLIAELSGAAERGRRDVQVRVADPAAGPG